MSRPRFRLNTLQVVTLTGTGLFLFAFLIFPMLHILSQAFFVDGRFTLAYFLLIFRDAAQWDVILNSLNLAIAVTALTLLVAAPIAFAMVRYDFRGKSILSGLLLVPMVLPPFVGAVGMRQMLARFGSVNLFLMDMGWIREPIDWLGGGGLGAVIVLEVLHLYPIMYLNLAAALANVDPSLEEAGRNLGARGFGLFRRITFPLMLPGAFAGASIVFIWAFTDLGTPLMFDYRQVVPVQIFNMLSDLHENPVGYALVVFMMLLTAAIFFLSRSVMGGRSFEMLARGHVAGASRPASLPTTLLIHTGILAVTALALLPHVSVVLTSVSDRWFLTVLPEQLTGKYYAMVFNHEMTSAAIRNSLLLSAASTIVDVILGVAIAYVLARTVLPGRVVLDVLTMLPLAVPGIVIAFGYVGAFSGTWLDARINPIPLLICGYAIRRLPYMVRSAYAGFQQTSAALEEAAQNLGATPFTALRRITMPLIFANLVAGGILCFSFAMLEVSDSLILAMEERFYPITKAIYILLSRPDGPYIASALGVLGMLLLMASLFAAGRFLGRRMGELFRV